MSHKAEAEVSPPSIELGSFTIQLQLRKKAILLQKLSELGSRQFVLYFVSI
jgi:hypothetical protein